jgi:TPR repeat protein
VIFQLRTLDFSNVGAFASFGSMKKSSPLQQCVVQLILLTIYTLIAVIPTTSQLAESKTLDALKRRAETGDVRAQLELAIRYAKGDGIEVDKMQSAKWFRRAAENGDPSAQNLLGGCYANGLGVAQDFKEAAKWYRLASEQGFKDGQYMLGLMYSNGLGPGTNLIEAVKLYRLAAAQGHARAAYALGYAYSVGDGVPLDDAEAMKWVRLSEIWGDERAAKFLRILQLGKTPEQLALVESRVKEALGLDSLSEIETYRDKNLNFQISFPKKWKRFSPADAQWGIRLNATASVLIGVARYTGRNEESLIDDVYNQEKLMQEELRKRIPTGELIQKKKTFLGSFPAVSFKMKYTLKNLDSELPIVVLIVQAIRDRLVYTVVFEAQESSFDAIFQQFEAIISSFVFL